MPGGGGIREGEGGEGGEKRRKPVKQENLISNSSSKMPVKEPRELGSRIHSLA